MKIKHSIIPILAILMTMLFAITASAGSNSDFVIVDGELGAYNGPGGDVVIPAGVTSITGTVFDESKHVHATPITSVTINEGCIEINTNAFSNCPSLKKVVLPSTLKKIGHHAFAECTSLQAIELPSGLTELGACAFQRTDLTAISFPAGLVSIPSSVCYGCKRLSSVTIEEGPVSIETQAFQSCTSLQNIVLPKSITKIYNGAFTGCNNGINVLYLGDLDYYLGLANNMNERIKFLGNNKPLYPDNCNPVGISEIKMKKIQNVVSGVHVYWYDVAGISKYQVYRSTTGKEKDFKLLAECNVAHYIDTNVQGGQIYYYKVFPVYGAFVGGGSSVLSMTFVGTPDITSRTNTSTGIKVGWDKQLGATGYAIYRKGDKSTDSWARVATISGNATFTWMDTSAKPMNGTVLHYTVRALTGPKANILSGCRSTGRTMVRLFTPTITACTASQKQKIVEVNWNKNASATGYQVRFMQGSTVVKTVKHPNSQDVQTLVGDLASGTYDVQVRSYYDTKGTGTYYSAWSAKSHVTL